MATTTTVARLLGRGEDGTRLGNAMGSVAKQTSVRRSEARRVALLFGTSLLLALMVAPAAAVAKAAVSRCSTSQLRVSLVRSDAATSHRYWDLSLQNRGTTTCRLQGYPGVGLVGQGGGLLQVGVRRVAGFARAAVEVSPGGRAYFTFGYVTAGPCGSRAFKVYGLQIIPPDEHAHLVLRRQPFAVCDVAVGGSPVVYPVRKGLAGP